MSPILMTREERSLLLRLLQQPLPTNEMPEHAASKFIKHGLAAKEAVWYTITMKGQLELLRQRFRNMRRRRVVTLTGASFRQRFHQAMADRLSGAPRSTYADETEE